jgi:hypothetical protein
MLSTSREGLQGAEFPGSFSDPLRLGKFAGDLPAARRAKCPFSSATV